MRKSGIVVGTVSLIMIFAVLSMTVFAMMTLSTANDEARLSDISAEQTTLYYYGDTKAVKIAMALKAGNRQSEIEQIPIEYQQQETTLLADYQVPAGNHRKIHVSLELTQQDSKILCWELLYDGEWQADTKIEVWDGQRKKENVEGGE